MGVCARALPDWLDVSDASCASVWRGSAEGVLVKGMRRCRIVYEGLKAGKYRNMEGRSIMH